MIDKLTNKINNKLFKFSYSKKMTFIILCGIITSYILTILLCYIQSNLSKSIEKQMNGLIYAEHLGHLLNNILIHQATMLNLPKEATDRKTNELNESRIKIDTSFNKFLENIKKDLLEEQNALFDEEMKINVLVNQFKQKWEDFKRWEIEHHDPNEGIPFFEELVNLIKEIYHHLIYSSELVMNIDSGTHRLIDLIIYNLIDTSIMLPKLIAMGEIHLNNSGVTATQRVNLLVLKNLFEKNLEAIIQSFQDSVKENSSLNSLFVGSETQSFLGEYTNSAKYFLKLIETKLLKHNPTEITIKEYTLAGINVINNVIELEKNTIDLIRKVLMEQLGTLNFRSNTSIILVLIGSLVVFIFYLSKVIRKPLEEFKKGIEQFTLGDLSVRIPITSNDEVAEMTEEFNLMAEQFDGMIKKFQSISRGLLEFSKKIKLSILELEKNIYNQQQAINNISNHSKGISKTVYDFRMQLSDVNFSVTQTSQLAEVGLGSLNEMKKVINNMNMGTTSIVTSLTDLQKNVGIINTVISEIIKIVDQANILSLNSAITAYRSGAKGAGFTVVSDKITELADQTAYFTLDIEKKASEIAPEVIMGVNYVDKFTSGIKKQESANQQTDDELRKLISYTQSQTSMFEIVNTSMLNQLKGATDIESSISELSNVSQNTTKSVTNLFREINYLCEMTDVIHTILSVFHVSKDKEELSKVEEINSGENADMKLLKKILKISKKELVKVSSNDDDVNHIEP